MKSLTRKCVPIDVTTKDRRMNVEEKLDRCIVAPVAVIEGCVCSGDKPWYYCTCDTRTFEYNCLCHNFEDVIDGSNTVPSDIPTVDAVAYLITKHPTARFIYTGCKNYWSPKYGQGDHFKLAQKAAADMLGK
jgi:hypothetical protein